MHRPGRDTPPPVVYHGTRATFDVFEAGHGDGFHFGTIEQARMRSLGRNGRIIAAEISVCHPLRMREAITWRDAIRSARRRGYDSIVYLNRYEGTSFEQLDALLARGWTGERLDALPDREFARLMPQARDSWIVFDPQQIRIIDPNYDAPAARRVAVPPSER